MDRARLTRLLIGPVDYLKREQHRADPHKMIDLLPGWMRCDQCGILMISGPLEAAPVDKDGYQALLSMRRDGWVRQLPGSVGFEEPQVSLPGRGRP